MKVVHFLDRNKQLALCTVYCAFTFGLFAQYAYGDKWYQNPLGFKPLNLHTNMGFIVPAAITGIAVLLTKKDSTLQHKFAVYSEGAATFGYKQPYTLVWQQSTGVNFRLRKWLSAGAEFSTTLPNDDYNQTVGFSIRPFARFYPVYRDRWSLWFESGGGIIYFLNQFPQPTPHDARTGTYWNGITKYGIGAKIRLHRGVALDLGIRHLHVSNGNTKGSENNPSHDSNGFFIGITWHPKNNYSL